jgi:iron complex outermembrane receptor protein
MADTLRGPAGGRLVLMLGASLATLAGALCAAPAQAAAAASGPTIEEVVVTAEKRPENVQSVGMSISAFSGSQIEKQNISNAADLARFVPSLSVNQANNNRNSEISIRNVGTAGTNPGTEPDVGVFIDGVYVPVAGPIYGELTDISTVEVLRGPQGTLYGRNTPMGAINITTRAPSQARDGMLELEYGNFNHMRVKGVVGGGLTDTLAGRLSFWSDSNSGYLKNLYNDTRVDKKTDIGGRGRLRWTPDAQTTVDLIGYYNRIDAEGNSGVQLDPLGPGGIVFGYNPVPTSFAASPFIIAQKANNPLHPYVVTGKWEVNSARGAPDTTTTWGASVEASRQLDGLGATLTDILAYNSYLDSAPDNAPGSLPLDITSNLQRDKLNTTSNELRLVSSGERFIDYVAGLYLFHNELTYIADRTTQDGANRVFPPAQGGGGKMNVGDHSVLVYNQTTNAAAAYVQATVHLRDNLRLIGGARYSYDHKTSTIVQTVDNPITGVVSGPFLAQVGKNASLAGRISAHSLTWTTSVQYDLREGMMLYALASSGFKDGGFNSRSASATPFAFDPETSLNYEAGLKSELFDRRMILNLDVFRTIVHAYQQSTLSPAGVGFIVSNAGNFRNQGVELDLQAHPIAPLSVNASASYVDSVITGGAEHLQCDTSYPFAGSAPPASSGPFSDASHSTCNFDSLTLPDAPEWQWSVAARWEQPVPGREMNWFVAANVTAQTSQYLDPSLDPRALQPGYALWGALLGVESANGRWRVQLWGHNLTDRRYILAAAPQTQAALVSGGGTKAANGFIGWLGQPRTYGIELTTQF